MLPPLPVLSDYGISPEYGFLPAELPLERLPDPYYHKWEAIVANLQALVLSKRLRGVIDRLPVLSTIGLEHDAEWRRAYLLLAFMANGYIWGGDTPSEVLPEPIAIPFLKVSEYLEIPPVATYAAEVLWNFKPLFVDEHVDNLENLSTLATYTGSIDESWFYLVSVAIEARGAPVIRLMLAAIAAARANDAATVTLCLKSFAERLDDLASLLRRMHENCDPHTFYHRVRPFLAGSKNMADAGLPRGVRYMDGSLSPAFRQYSGGSNAQSSLIQFFDLVLGVEHHPTGGSSGGSRDATASSASESESEPDRGPRPPKPRHNFIHDMRTYMPGAHRRFLEAVDRCANVRAFVAARPHDAQLVLAYDACLAMLQAFRAAHIAIVTRYIIIPSRAALAQNPAAAAAASPGSNPSVAVAAAVAATPPTTTPLPLMPQRKNLATASAGLVDANGKKKKLTGTGGTALLPFLRQARDETGDPAVAAWTRRVLGRGGRRPGKGDFWLGKDEELEVEVLGLAGTWTMDEGEGGGLCHY